MFAPTTTRSRYRSSAWRKRGVAIVRRIEKKIEHHQPRARRRKADQAKAPRLRATREKAAPSSAEARDFSRALRAKTAAAPACFGRCRGRQNRGGSLSSGPRAGENPGKFCSCRQTAETKGKFGKKWTGNDQPRRRTRRSPPRPGADDDRANAWRILGAAPAAANAIMRFARAFSCS